MYLATVPMASHRYPNRDSVLAQRLGHGCASIIARLRIALPSNPCPRRAVVRAQGYTRCRFRPSGDFSRYAGYRYAAGLGNNLRRMRYARKLSSEIAAWSCVVA